MSSCSNYKGNGHFTCCTCSSEYVLKGWISTCSTSCGQLPCNCLLLSKTIDIEWSSIFFLLLLSKTHMSYCFSVKCQDRNCISQFITSLYWHIYRDYSNRLWSWIWQKLQIQYNFINLFYKYINGLLCHCYDRTV